MEIVNCSSIGTAVSGAAVVGGKVLLTQVGFTSAGIAAGSVAAGLQASIGNVVAGTTFAVLQSVAATGVVSAIAPYAAGLGVATLIVCAAI